MPPGAPARTADPGRAQVPVLRWDRCTDPPSPGFQCATARVPLDYDAPGGPAIGIAVIRHPATQPWHRLGSLFINYGGPGDAGAEVLPPSYHVIPAGLRQRFDIVSFNPRGVGKSTAVRCFPTAAAENKFLASLPEGFPAGKAQTYRWMTGFATLGRLCQQRAGGLLRHISTADVARDMDLLRQAVGDPVLNYLGMSYGTYLGATYANLFPGSAGALVLDGALAPTTWARPRQVGRLPLSTFMRVGQDMGMKATLGQFLDLCGRARTRHCRFSAGTPHATRAKYAALLLRLRRHRVTVRGVTVTYASLVAKVGGALFFTSQWPGLAATLEATWHASAQPTAASPSASRMAYPPPAPFGSGLPATGGYPGKEQTFAIYCADSPNPRHPANYAAEAAFGYARSGAFGPLVAWRDEACATWPATDAHGYYGPWNHWTLHPILVVGTTYDPSTPYAGAVGATHELARARLLTVSGYGHTG